MPTLTTLIVMQRSFTDIMEGAQDREVWLGRKTIRRIAPKQQFELSNEDGDRGLVRVTTVRIYPATRSMLLIEPWQKLRPSAASEDEVRKELAEAYTQNQQQRFELIVLGLEPITYR